VKLPLQGVRVLDLSRVLAGPFCTMGLGDLGAEVIKIEEPKRGDDTRAFGPPFVNGESTYFLSINRNKKSVAVDLKSKEVLALVQQLADSCDVVVENFRPGVADKLGLGEKALRAKNPRLIYCSISGFGHTGLPEHSARPGYDAVVQGLSGLMEVTGQSDGPPTRVGVPISDLLTGMTALQSILTALYARERTGEGTFLDVAMLDATVQVLTFHAASSLNAGTTPRRLGNRHASIAPYEVFEASDGLFNLAVGNDGQFAELCTLLDLPALPRDARFASNPERVKNRPALTAELQPCFSARPVAHWLKVLDDMGIPAGAVVDVGTALSHPQLAARSMLPSFQHPLAGALRLVGSPLPGADAARAAPPTLGQHTREVFEQILKVPKADVDRLAKTGAVRLG
jgi:crotonobetainyl-CoA:carnitine CoA-transferase CaiB-like acyl-CoA transferase